MCILKQSIAPYVQEPFHFVETGINVYSFEELLFHSYHYWKESTSDFVSGNMSKWIRESLGLAFLAGQVDKIANSDEMLSEKYLKFLSLEGYFDNDDLYMLEFKIMTWENKSELDKIKLQGDERLEAEDYEKAMFYYNKLLTFGENSVLYNNLGCCSMKLGRLSQAEAYLKKAGELDWRNSRIKLNQAMLYLLQNRSQLAEAMLLELEQTDNDRDVQYYLGDLEFRRNNLNKAYAYFNLSAKMGNDIEANTALCKLEIKRKDFDKAKMFIEQLPDKSSRKYLENMAQINYLTGNKTAALRNIEQLIIKNFDKTDYWAMAAKLYRETGNLEKAAGAIEKANEIDPANEQVIFENARLKKEQGKMTEYKQYLKQITAKWKSNYKAI